MSDSPNFALEDAEVLECTEVLEAHDVFEEESSKSEEDVPPTPGQVVILTEQRKRLRGDGDPGAPPCDLSLTYECFKDQAVRDEIYKCATAKHVYQEVACPVLPTKRQTPGAIYKLDQAMVTYFELFPTMGIARQMKASFKAKRIKQLVAIKMRYKEVGELVEREWAECERDLFAGHLMFCFWKMLGYCGATEDIH